MVNRLHCRRYPALPMLVALKSKRRSAVRTQNLILRFVESDSHKCWLSPMRCRNARQQHREIRLNTELNPELPFISEVFENDFASADSDAGAFFNVDLGDHTVFDDG